jgi:Holliday junction resolvase RusA-like endonuclease
MKGRDWGRSLVEKLRAKGDPRVAGLAERRRRPVKRARPNVATLEPANLGWIFTIEGAPRTKGNSRSGVGTIPSAAYRRWFHAAMEQVPLIRRAAIHGVIQVPVIVKATFFRARAGVADLDNYTKGLGDYLQRAGFITNDSLIRGWDGSRLELDRDHPRIVVEIEAAQ